MLCSTASANIRAFRSFPRSWANPSEFDRLAQSGIAELGNVITGQASRRLAEAGFQADISPPTLVMGKGTLISTLDFQRLMVPLRTPLGDLQINLALRESGDPSDGARPAPGK